MVQKACKCDGEQEYMIILCYMCQNYANRIQEKLGIVNALQRVSGPGNARS